MRPRVINFLTNASSSAAGLYVPLLAGNLGSSTAEIGFIVAAYNAFTLFSSILFGRSADVRGVGRILRAGLLASGAACLIQPLAWDPWSLLGARALLGFCAGMYPGALLAYARTADPLMGKFSSWGSLGWALGNALAGVLTTIAPSASFWEVFAMAGGSWFLGFFLVTTTPSAPAGGIRVPFFPRTVLRRNFPVYAAMFIRHTGANMVWAIFPLYLALSLHLSDLEIGMIYALNPLVQFLVMQVADRYGITILIVAGLVSSAWTFILFTLAWDFWSMLATQILLGIAWGTLYVGSLKFIVQATPETGTAGGWFNGVTSLAAIVGPILGGLVALDSFVITMYVAAILSVVALGVYLASIRGARTPSAT